MEKEKIRRILHAKNYITKITYFHNEIIKHLEKGERVALVNMPEFESIGDSRIIYKSIDDINSIKDVQAAFIFEIYPRTVMLESLSKISCNEINVSVMDFSAMFRDLFIKTGFKTLYISDDYIAKNAVYGSIEELTAAVLRTIT